jgi:hypothetical protein
LSTTIVIKPTIDADFLTSEHTLAQQQILEKLDVAFYK